MATNTDRSFSTMLNQYLPNQLLREELIKRDWFLQNVKKDQSWEGGTIIVPFEASPIVKSTSVIVSSLVSMNPMVSDPIHAATAMETATVTAMSMMAATTGLRAFLLLRSFLIFVPSLLTSSIENCSQNIFNSYDLR